MQRIIFILLASIITLSCKSSFEDMLKSKDIEKKKEMAFELYEDEDYYKASDLFKALIQDVSGGKEIEKMFYYYAMCDFNLEDYGLAAYEFERLIQKFPRGSYTEEAQFMIGKSNYEEAPQYHLDQDYTYRAIESFQLFLDKFPQSKKRDEANKLVDELTYRLEKKAYIQAKLYYRTGDYKSASVALENVLNDFPDTRHHEEVNYLVADSKFLLADKSVESKKIKRFKEARSSAAKFQRKYKESKYVSDAAKIEENAKAEIRRLKLDLPKFYYEKGKYDEAIGLYETLIRHERNEDKRNELTLRLFQVYHAKARNARTEKKVKYYEEMISFLTDQKEVQTTYLKTNIGKEVESAELGYEKQKSSAAYELYKEGKYYYSVRAYQKLLRIKDVPNKNKHVYFLMLNSYKYAEKLEAKRRESVLDSLLIRSAMYGVDWDNADNSYASKAKRLIVKTKEALTAYPILLVESPISNKDYKTAINRAKKLIGSDISKENKEEVVYLLIAAAVKHARKGKRFERLGRYEYAEKVYNQYASMASEVEWTSKITALKLKIDKGITKYQIKEE